jgi:hypothetical protein
MVRRALLGAALLVLLALGWWTLTGGMRNLHQARTVGQQVETVIQLACGLLCAAVVVTRFRWRLMHRPMRIAWALSLMTWVSLSALVWGPPMLHIALLFAIVAVLLACALLWALGPALPA